MRLTRWVPTVVTVVLWLAMANTISQNVAPVPLLWILPLLALLAGLAGIIVLARRRTTSSEPPEPLSSEEQAKVATLVGSGPEGR